VDIVEKGSTDVTIISQTTNLVTCLYAQHNERSSLNLTIINILKNSRRYFAKSLVSEALPS